MKQNSPEYLEKKKFFDQVLTIYGRKPVLEALSNSNLKCFRLHLADSNKPAQIIKDLIKLAEAKHVEILHCNKKELSRISKNAKQDQGVALDLILPSIQHCDDFFKKNTQTPFEFIALEKVTNPQNLGMIIRSICASPVTGLLLPLKGCASLDSLVIKASAGTLFKASIILCPTLKQGLALCKENNATILGLDAQANSTLKDLEPNQSKVFVLGNETEGLSAEVRELCDSTIAIPMQNNVESLNVAVTASLLAFRSVV